MKKLLLISSILILLTACATPYPLGMDEKQWKSLSTGERKALLLKQQEQQAKQRLAQIKADARARELRIKQEMIEARRLEKLYADPRNGNVLMVNILGGEFKQGKRIKRIQEDSFEIARGETKKINFIVEDLKKHYTSTETAYLKYSHNGNAVYLYINNPAYNSSKRIALLRDGQWACGSHYTKNLHTSYEKLIGMQFFVKESGSSCRFRGHRDRYDDRDNNYRGR